MLQGRKWWHPIKQDLVESFLSGLGKQAKVADTREPEPRSDLTVDSWLRSAYGNLRGSEQGSHLLPRLPQSNSEFFTTEAWALEFRDPPFRQNWMIFDYLEVGKVALGTFRINGKQ